MDASGVEPVQQPILTGTLRDLARAEPEEISNAWEAPLRGWRKLQVPMLVGFLTLLGLGLLMHREWKQPATHGLRPIFLAKNVSNAANATANATKAEDEECRNALPGEPCYGAVLWHKWIGLVEQPQNYVNLTREANRHNIQSWLYQRKKNGCPKPCKESIAYPIPKAPAPAYPKIYCFSVARTGPEMDQMFMQRQTGTGIFACNGFDVYSDNEVDIDGYQAKIIPSTAAGVSIDRTAANSQVFMKTWMNILYTDWWYKFDFLAKVDPDAVLFPDRLRNHVRSHWGQNVFFLNCAVHHPAMYGAVEVFSKKAMGAYLASHARCEKSLPFWSWGEDRYLQECLKMIGVQPIPDYTNNVRDARCWGSDCGNKAAVAFHPFKTVNSWYRCHMASQ